MDIKIAGEKENSLLKRKEVVAEIAHPGKATPLRKEMISGLAKALKSKEELVIVDKIFTRKGTASCEARVLVYKKKEDIPKEKLERQERRLSRKKKPAKEKPEAKKEAPKEAEAKKEEGKKEEKPAEKPGEEKPVEKKEPEKKPEEKQEPKK